MTHVDGSPPHLQNEAVKHKEMYKGNTEINKLGEIKRGRQAKGLYRNKYMNKSI